MKIAVYTYPAIFNYLKILSDKGYSVDFFCDSNSLLEKFRGDSEAIVAYVTLYIKDTVETIRKLKKNNSQNKIIVEGKAEISSLLIAVEAGASGFVTDKTIAIKVSILFDIIEKLKKDNNNILIDFRMAKKIQNIEPFNHDIGFISIDKDELLSRIDCVDKDKLVIGY